MSSDLPPSLNLNLNWLFRWALWDHRPARRPPVYWVDAMFTLYDTAGGYFLDEI
jgi:hypothetical protein